MKNDRIIIRGLKLWTCIGVPAEERASQQMLRAHIILWVNPFPEDDKIAETVDYKEVSDRLVEVAGQGERKLLETLAGELARAILNGFPVSKVEVELEKYILPETDWVGVAIERSAIDRN